MSVSTLQVQSIFNHFPPYFQKIALELLSDEVIQLVQAKLISLSQTETSSKITTITALTCTSTAAYRSYRFSQLHPTLQQPASSRLSSFIYTDFNPLKTQSWIVSDLRWFSITHILPSFKSGYARFARGMGGRTTSACGRLCAADLVSKRESALAESDRCSKYSFEYNLLPALRGLWNFIFIFFMSSCSKYLGFDTVVSF
ncbi:Hypothetical_protein [Hexamita inflata]|uniref:Hypothetical_protein n=1 Tax=Hexamita inflata TaxID=28002 RepID=A0AA86UDJ4_9EUKA|nr:Hypothetical protein HINF_LOCUS35401 [Hexamita inflata]